MDVQLDLEVDAIAGVLMVTVRGGLVGDAVEPLRRCLERAVGAGRPVVVDLVAVDHLDRAGLAVLEDAHAELGRRLRVVVRRGGPIHATLKIGGLAHTLALHSSALAAAESAPAASG